MSRDQERHNELLALLLAPPEDAAGMSSARERLLHDASFRAEFEALRKVGGRLSETGEALAREAGAVDLVQDVQYAIAHQALEALAVANGSPYGPVEAALRDFKRDFEACAGEVSLVEDVMAAVAAARQSDAAVEAPYPRETAGLRELGNELAARAPRVDLVEPVLSGAAEYRRDTVTPFRARPVRAKSIRAASRRPVWPRVVGWAAVLALVAGGAWVYRATDSGPVAPPRVTQQSDPADGGQRGPELESDRERMARRVAERPEADADPVEPPAAADEAPVERAGRAEDTPLTLQEVINARRRDLVNDTQAMAALASLTEEEAIQLLQEMNLSVEALLGATQSLSAEEAIAVLRAAVAEDPEDPHLRYALAQNLAGDPDAVDERLEHLEHLAAADADNGLPHFMMASDYLAQGYTDLGLDALARGSAHTEASAYGLEHAQQREAALIASGLEPDVARFLALSGAGDAEYTDIALLRNELLDYGAFFEEQGEFESARQVYNAVNQLGQQLTVDADLAVERQVGMETQQEAIRAIQNIAEAFEEPGIVAALSETLSVLATGLADIGRYIQAQQEMVRNPGLADQIDWPALLNHMIQNGDLNIADFLE